MSDSDHANQRINLLGRYAYLKALQECWPEVLATLRRDVFPLYVPATSGAEDNPVIPPDRWIAIKNDPARTRFVEEMEYWAEHYYIRDTWLFDAALQTMCMAHRLTDVTNVAESCWENWTYLEILSPPLTVRIPREHWRPPEYGGRESWADFSGRIRTTINRQLTEYRALIKQRFAIGTSENERDARWLALSQKGRSIQEIAGELPRPYDDPVQAVSKAVARFAKSIGLTRRA